MFYSMRIVLLTCLASFSGMHAISATTTEENMSALKGVRLVTVGMSVDCLVSTDREKLASFAKGAGSVACGIILGYLLGMPINREYSTTTIGALCAIALDHCIGGGKEDKHQLSRKSGNAFPIIISGGVLCYPYLTGDKQLVAHQDDGF